MPTPRLFKYVHSTGKYPAIGLSTRHLFTINYLNRKYRTSQTNENTELAKLILCNDTSYLCVMLVNLIDKYINKINYV
jgi:hypothetical protein